MNSNSGYLFLLVTTYAVLVNTVRAYQNDVIEFDRVDVEPKEDVYESMKQHTYATASNETVGE
jgi:hypothetical protein